MANGTGMGGTRGGGETGMVARQVSGADTAGQAAAHGAASGKPQPRHRQHNVSYHFAARGLLLAAAAGRRWRQRRSLPRLLLSCGHGEGLLLLAPGRHEAAHSRRVAAGGLRPAADGGSPRRRAGRRQALGPRSLVARSAGGWLQSDCCGTSARKRRHFTIAENSNQEAAADQLSAQARRRHLTCGWWDAFGSRCSAQRSHLAAIWQTPSASAFQNQLLLRLTG